MGRASRSNEYFSKGLKSSEEKALKCKDLFEVKRCSVQVLGQNLDANRQLVIILGFVAFTYSKPIPSLL